MDEVLPLRNAILLTLIGVVLVSIITIAAAHASPVEAPPELAASSEPRPPAHRDTSGYPYLLRTYDGKLAVFTDDLVEPDLVFDVYVQSLPEYDRKELERGVRVENYQKLTALIEDYIS